MVRVITSPTRPMACESELIMEMMPMSCSTSSAPMVSGRMRESAKEMSSGTLRSRWWQTIIMSRCSSTVLRVNGMVGFVELGSTLGNPAARMMSGAWPPPAPSVWYVWMARPLNAAMVSSTQPPSFRVSVWMATCTSISSATPSAVSMTAGVAPQSSWILSPAAPARICSRSGSGLESLPLPR